MVNEVKMKFRYKFTRSVYITALIAAVSLVSILCFVLNLIRLINILQSTEVTASAYNYISVILCLILPIICAVFIIAMLTNSYYKVDGGTLIVRLGLFNDKYKTQEAESIILNVKTDVLTVVFKDGSPLRIIIDKNSFNEFSAELMKSNKNIVYGETDETDKKNKN